MLWILVEKLQQRLRGRKRRSEQWSRRRFQILRQGRGYLDPFSVRGSREGEGAGMQGVPSDEVGWRAVQIVTENGTAQSREMDAELVSPARQGRGKHQRVTVFLTKNPISGQGAVAALAFTAIFPYDNAFCRTAHISIDETFRLFGNPAEDRQIPLADLALLHGVKERGSGDAVSRDEQKTAGVAIQSVDGTEHEWNTKTLVTKGERVGYGIIVMVVGRVRRHIGGLVGDDHVLVLVRNGEGK